jgi:hypothetical protein
MLCQTDEVYFLIMIYKTHVTDVLVMLLHILVYNRYEVLRKYVPALVTGLKYYKMFVTLH